MARSVNQVFHRWDFVQFSSFWSKGKPTPRRQSYKAVARGVVTDEEHHSQQTSTDRPSHSNSADLWSSLSTFILDENWEPTPASDTSQNMLGLSASLFDDASSFIMEEEKPAQYVPAPPIDAADLELSTKLEDVLYILRDVLPGPMNKIGTENTLLAAWRLVNDEVKVQDPLICFKGKDRLWHWLHTLAAADIVVDLHEIYAESIRGHPFKGCVYAVWTLSFPQDMQSNLMHFFPNPYGYLERIPSQLKLSGESKFEIDNTGQVLSIESQWYITKEEGEEMFETAKMCLAALLLKEANV